MPRTIACARVAYARRASRMHASRHKRTPRARSTRSARAAQRARSKCARCARAKYARRARYMRAPRAHCCARFERARCAFVTHAARTHAHASARVPRQLEETLVGRNVSTFQFGPRNTQDHAFSNLGGDTREGTQAPSLVVL
eukprot:1798989-Pleurochrysis_carterae.AAC.1